ncbi:hypothetical protein HW555_013503 [Spodoptera exigua]|uniref:Uncharacterized protein n=1 Tax=Spodoptera exigua TaxID=7107 RepID=A0A835G5J1_SPOEX|nr:hypothetical protein HW555_013503 [Spodoptera exigua]
MMFAFIMLPSEILLQKELEILKRTCDTIAIYWIACKRLRNIFNC